MTFALRSWRIRLCRKNYPVPNLYKAEQNLPEGTEETALDINYSISEVLSWIQFAPKYTFDNPFNILMACEESLSTQSVEALCCLLKLIHKLIPQRR